MLLCPTCGAAYRGAAEVCDSDGQRLVPAADLDPRIGSQIGNYRLLDMLGRGGMGVVYKAEHAYIGKPSAIKILHEHTATPDAIERLLREARAAAIIGHANIIDVSDFGETPEGQTYFVMELVEGHSLDEVLQTEGQLSLLRSINIVNQIGRGLGAAHDKGIIHRDLKPANVMLQLRPGRREIVSRRSDQFEVRKEGSYDFVKILDFGVARFLDGEANDSSARDDILTGTPHYMAPEVISDHDVVDHRVDVYALGVMFFEMLTGTVPFDGATSVDVLMAHCDEQAPTIQHRNPNAQINDAAQTLIRRAMAKDPAERPQTMYEFLDELQGCWGDEVYVRDVERRMPEAVGAGIHSRDRPRARRLTEDLAELLSQGSDVVEDATDEPPPRKRI